jgi:hypothetical protein
MDPLKCVNIAARNVTAAQCTLELYVYFKRLTFAFNMCIIPAAKEGRFPNKNAFSACRGSLSHLSQRLNFYFWGVRSWFQVHYFASVKCRWLNLRCLFNIYDIVFEPPDSAFFWLSALEYYFI